MINWGRNWGEVYLDLFLKFVFEQATGIYRDSGVSVAFDVVHSEQVDFSHIDADWLVDLSYALMNSEGGSSYLNQYISEIGTLLSHHSADLVVYWRQFNDGCPGSNGGASTGQSWRCRSATTSPCVASSGSALPPHSKICSAKLS